MPVRMKYERASKTIRMRAYRNASSVTTTKARRREGAKRLKAHSQGRYQWQMVRRDQRASCSHQLHLLHFDVALVVDVIEMHHREDPWIGASPAKVRRKVDALQPLAQQRRGGAARPLVEVAQHDFWSGDAPVADDAGQALGLD